MARKSRAVRELETLLAQTTDLQQRADLATRLSRAQDAEGRERARRARRAKATKPKAAATSAPYDPNEFFDVNDGQPPYIAVLTQPAPLPIKPELPREEKRPVNDVEPAKFGDGHGETRVIDALNFPGADFFDQNTGQWRDDTFPRSSVGNTDTFASFGAPAVGEPLEYIDGQLLTATERKQREKAAEDAAFREYGEKLGWR